MSRCSSGIGARRAMTGVSRLSLTAVLSSNRCVESVCVSVFFYWHCPFLASRSSVYLCRWFESCERTHNSERTEDRTENKEETH